MDQELLCSGWTGEDELKLLCCLEENGYGNWVSISRDLRKTPYECCYHYHKYYFNWDVNDDLSFERTESIPSDFICDFSSMDLPGKEIPHYNPLRRDFEIEPDNDAEKALTVTECLLDDDEDVEKIHEECDDNDFVRRLVLALVDSYLQTLQWREMVKRRVEEHELLDVYRMLSLEKALSPEEQLVKNTVRPFVRFLNQTELNDLERSFNKELLLVERVKLLKEYHSMGISTLKAAELYEHLKVSRQNMRERKMKAIRKLLKAEESFHHRSNSILSLETPPSGVQMRKGQLNSVVPLDLSVCSGVDLLQSDEKTFCSNFRILPDIFLRCKKQMTLEYKKSGFLRLMDARRICRIDVNKTRKIYNFLIEKEIIKPSK